MDEKVKIIIADDHPLMRKGIKDILEENKDWIVVGEAGDGQQTLELFKKLKPDVLIIDIDMPKLNGLEVIKIIKDDESMIRIIILTMYDEEIIFNRAMDLNVMGYVIKDSVVTEIYESVKNVLAGKHYISPSISGFLVKRDVKINTVPNYIAGISKLTPTERKILSLISKNYTSKSIANKLFVSVKTIETHRSNICQKLGIHGTNALLKFALMNKEIL
ncbi:MAG: response regulator transcription factor [Ignavibacteriota bacterium]|nr:DNA-binding response regulator [Ignavibacteriota bacterium]MCO6446813.1 response regulator transcription factor [Ignavibacterium album]MCZ2268662.1 response regulator transcription factor [Ignavibacteriales bacterium]QKJ98696.1 MAG: response regulator transcription factor [Ignavibacteriota bacterium]HOJ08880.1 response regulator transcription factor [Ignavibacteriaceae bacterium]